MSSAPASTPPNPPEPSQPVPFITQHTAIILLAAFVIGLIIGSLTFLSGTSAAGSVLASLVSAGGSVPVLRSLIG